MRYTANCVVNDIIYQLLLANTRLHIVTDECGNLSTRTTTTRWYTSCC